MVYGLIQTVRTALKYRGGWRGLLEHMYTNGDWPPKMGTYMGHDPAGNRYYENRVDYPYGQHRWVEPSDIHNFDSTSISPDWHGWMTSTNDSSPCNDEQYITEQVEHVAPLCQSNAPYAANVGHQEDVFNFHHLHNQSQVRSRGYGIGNPIVCLPPHVKDSFYTQPASPYNVASIHPRVMIGDLDEKTGGGRPYKSEKWKDRLRTKEERETIIKERENNNRIAKEAMEIMVVSRKEAAIRSRGGSVICFTE